MNDCTIVIGCVYSAARIITSRGCKVTVASRFLSLTNSSDCAVNVLTSGHPLVLSGCRRIVLGPYNTSYAEIENNINNCGLKEAKNGDMFSKQRFLLCHCTFIQKKKNLKLLAHIDSQKENYEELK